MPSASRSGSKVVVRYRAPSSPGSWDLGQSRGQNPAGFFGIYDVVGWDTVSLAG